MQERKKIIRQKNFRRNLFVFSCIALPILNFLVLYVYVNFSAIVMAFTNASGVLSFDNFVAFWKELKDEASLLRDAIPNTMITFGIAFITFPFKVLVSYFIYKKVPFAGFYRIIFFLPTIIFSVALNFIFIYMIGPEGFIAQAIQEWSGLGPDLLADSRTANFVIWGQMLWLSFPGDLIIWGGTFTRIPQDVLESAQIDGVTWWTEFTKIVVPMVWPTVSLQMVLLVCGIFGSTGNVWLLTQGEYGTHTISSWMYSQLYGGSLSSSSGVFNYMSAVGLSITVVAIILSTAVRKWTDKAFEEVEF